MKKNVKGNATEILKADHRQVKELFRQYDKEADTAWKTRQQIVERVCRDLETHTRMEEEAFYPAVADAARRLSSTQEQEQVDEAREEHAGVKDLIDRLRRMEPRDEDYNATFQELMRNVEHHIEEEEGEMFPWAEKNLSGNLEQLGEKMSAIREGLVGSRTGGR